MNRNYSFSSKSFAAFAQFIFLGMVAFGLILPAGAQAFQSDLTPTPTITVSPTPLSTSTPAPLKEYNWRSMPGNSAALASDRPLALLSGKLIFHGLVDATVCPNNGLLESGAASACGERVSQNAVILWQNQFDEEILKIAREKEIPPFILKNVFARESQFWPRTFWNPNYGGEYGMGHVTYLGSDTLLSWNRPFYLKLCKQNFTPEACKKEYVFQDPSIKASLKGLVLKSINADCTECAGGIDMQKARNGILITAETLIANRNYIEWQTRNYASTTQLAPINVWRYALASYNVGPGCFGKAFYDARRHGNPFSWQSVAEQFNEANCKLAIAYVDYVMENVDTADPAALQRAATDTSLAARIVLGASKLSASADITLTPTSTVIVSETPAPTFAATETPTLDSPLTATEPPASEETPTPDSSASETPVETASPASEVTATPETETPAPDVTQTPTPSVSETPTAVVTPTETPTTDPFETPAEPTVEPTATPTEDVTATPAPTFTATPVPPPTLVPPAPQESGEIMVKFGNLVPGFLERSTIQAAGGEFRAEVEELGLTIISAPQEKSAHVLSYLQQSVLVEYAEPNYTLQAFFTPNDPDYVNQTYLNDLQIPQAWDVTKGTGIIVAVIDTGVDVQHPDLANSIFINPGEDGLDANGNDKRSNYLDDDNDGYIDNWMGWNFVDNNNDARDGNGHGTHSAGIIAAQMDNAEGIAGVAPQARIMTIKALDNSGYGSYAQVAQAIIYAVDHGAKVINLGFGGIENSEALLEATSYAYQNGTVVVAAGGNTASQTTFYPAANPNVIGVSALDADLNTAVFSTYGDFIQLSAPGAGIYSTMPNGEYASMSGSSMSAAQVSGVAALLATQPQFNTPDTIRAALFSTARDLGDTGYDIHFGNGLAQAFSALSYSVNLPTPTPAPTKTPVSATATPVSGGVNAMAQEVFWASTQTCAGGTLNSGANSLVPPYAFDALLANCVGGFAANNGWTFTDFARPTNVTTTAYSSIYSATVDLRFYMTVPGGFNDIYYIQMSPNNGTNWYLLEDYDAADLPPSSLITNTYIVSSLSPDILNAVDTPAEVNNFRLRIWGFARTGGADTVTIYVDQASLTVVENTAPSVSISAPSNGSSYVQGRSINFTGSASDAEEGSLSGVIQWTSNIDGVIGTGGSFTKSNLSLGTHTITASVADIRGLTNSASVTITIVPNTAPVVSITSPLNNSTHAKGISIPFSATATDTQDGNIAADLRWYSDIDGPIGTGGGFSKTNLTPGTHIITASVTDLDGATTSANVTVTITPDHGSHGNFNASTDACSLCHRNHSASSPGDLLTSPNSSYNDNTFCLSCHSTGDSAVSTHSNKNGTGAKEADFELLCVQCHDPHGSSNLFAIRSNLRVGSLPTTFENMTTLSTPLVFTALKGGNSFDEIDSPENAVNNADDLCVACHVEPANPGYPVTAHSGGAAHLGGYNYAGESCIKCHPHNADTDSSTLDGFMPVRGSCLGCHATAQGSRRPVVGASGDFVRASHHVSTAITDTDCEVCHDQSQHQQGTVRLFNVDTPSTVYALDGSNDPDDYDNFCLSCHDNNGASGDTSPFSDNVNMAGTGLQVNTAAWLNPAYAYPAAHNTTAKAGSGYYGSCKDCHDNGHGSNKTNLLAPYNYTSTGTPTDDLMKQEEYFCYECHKSGGVGDDDVMTNYTRPTLWTQTGQVVGANSLTTLNDRHDISTTDQTTGARHSGAKVECTSCHNPHTDSPNLKVIADPDPADGRVPGTGYFTQGATTTDFFSDWCMDCHDGSYPSGVTPPTSALVNIYGSMTVNTHGAASGNVGTLEGGFGYNTGTIVQCRQCHGIHVQGPTPVITAPDNLTNLFSLIVRVRNASNTADVPTDGGSFNYESTNIGVTTPNISGYDWCQTCHIGSMGTNKTNCFTCHYHGAGGKW